MGADTDFNALYRELGVTASCPIEPFKLAYRRRVSRLHPDHSGSADALAQLQQLNRSYARAVEFQRLHGRLPGASRAPRSQDSAPTGPTATGNPGAPDWKRPPPKPLAGKRHPARYSLLVALIVVLLLWRSEKVSGLLDLNSHPQQPLPIGDDPGTGVGEPQPTPVAG